eukprot:Lankesteria_metandrocarpae@DN160_c0_g1_i2.p3
MKVMIDMCLIPMGVGVSVSKYVCQCQLIFDKRDLVHQLHPYGTTVEGEWDDVMAAVKECHETVHGLGAPRINTTLKIGTRVDREQTMRDKVRSVEEQLAAAPVLQQ